MDVPLSTRYCKVGLSKLAIPGRVVLSYEYNENYQPTIILVIGEDDKVGHFVCTWMDGTTRHFFDPYGKPAAHYGLRADFSNSFALQSDQLYTKARIKAIQTCARHCLMRLNYRHMSHNYYAEWLGPNADVTVMLHV